MFDSLTELDDAAAAAYALIFVFVAFDGVFPIVPGEVLVATGGVLAADGDLSLPLVLAATIAGGTLGDNASYLLGAKLGRRLAPRLFRGRRARELLDWARAQLAERGPVIIVSARFIPGGRTATTFAAGTLEFDWRRFFRADLLAVLLWSTYAVAIGYLGGETFEDSLWQPLLLAAAVAAIVAALGELYRRRSS